MKILVLTGAPALPQMFGGSQRTSNALIQGLMARGHHVELLAGFRRTHWVGVRSRIMFRLTGKPVAADRVLGYRVWRSWSPWDAVADVVKTVRPDVAIVLAHKPTAMARAARAAGIPVVLALQDVEFKDQGDDYGALEGVAGVANSQFTSDKYKERFGIKSAVVHPIIRAEDYAVSSIGDCVTFINPDPRKGLEIAIAVAKECSEIPFLFVDGWPIEPDVRDALADRVAALGNVTYIRPVADMRQVYRRTRILLAPSQWEEGYGRVATEAQVSGIPVVASNRGGLPEAVGDGGIVLGAQTPPDQWAAAVRSVWSDGPIFDQLSIAARLYSQRPQLHPETQFALWEAALLEAHSSSLCKDGKAF